VIVACTWLLLATTAAPVAAAAPSGYERPGRHAATMVEFPDLVDAGRERRPVPMRVRAPASGGPYPLVILSHGAGGNLNSSAYLAEHLVSHGYVVVSIEHIHSNTRQAKFLMSHAGGNLKLMDAIHRLTKDAREVLGRPRDVGFAIDRAIEWNAHHPTLTGRIDTARIGVMGHSFGAYTTLAVCGAQPIRDYLEPPVAPGTGLAGDLGDRRVRFGLAMSPQSPGTTFFGPDSYRSVRCPLVLLTGSRDVQKRYDGETLPAVTRREAFALLPPGHKYFVWLDNADHMAFGDGSSLLRSRARRDTHRIVRALALVAADRFLKDRPEAAAGLTEAYARSLLGRVVSDLEWLEK
jgi:predicted dienelactone hydrolase